MLLFYIQLLYVSYLKWDNFSGLDLFKYCETVTIMNDSLFKQYFAIFVLLFNQFMFEKVYTVKIFFF